MIVDVYEYGGLVYLKTPTSPNTNKLIGVQTGSLTLFQCPQRSRRIAEATTGLALGQPERGTSGPAGTPVGFSQGALTNGVGPEAAGGYRPRFSRPLSVPRAQPPAPNPVENGTEAD